MKKPFRERIKEGPIVCDGAMGTLLDLYEYEELPHEIQNLKNPDIVERVHREYVAAGSEIIESNTLSAIKELTDLPVVAQKAFAEDGAILSGNFPIEVIEHLIEQGADIVGANCTVGPQRMFSIIRNLHKDGVVLAAQPAAGIPTLLN